jgi:hypothetical protein
MKRSRLTLGVVTLAAAVACGSTDDGNGTKKNPGTGGSTTGGSAGSLGGIGGTAGSGGGGSGGTSGGAAGGTAGVAGTATGGAAGASTGGAAGAAGAADAGSDACAAVWCLDVDGDNYGDPNTKTCEKPDADATLDCNDCDDSQSEVSPEGVCHSVGYPIAGGGTSFDYNCDGKETFCGPVNNVSGPKCPNGLNQTECSAGNGYEPMNGKYCGSTKFRTCTYFEDCSGGTCAKTCLQNVGTAAAIQCK